MVRVNIQEFKRIKRLKKASRKAHAAGNAKLSAVGAGKPVSVRKAHKLGPLPDSIRKAVFERDRTCQGHLPGCFGWWGLAPHHKKFKSRGGDHSLKNLVLLCIPCHQKVHARYPDTEQFRVSRYARD